MTSYTTLRDWFIEVVFIRGTHFMLNIDDDKHLFGISKNDKLFEVTVTEHSNSESSKIIYEVNDIHNDRKTFFLDDYEAKRLIVDLIIENGIPFIIDPLGVNLRRRSQTSYF